MQEMTSVGDIAGDAVTSCMRRIAEGKGTPASTFEANDVVLKRREMNEEFFGYGKCSC